ncbi:MAG TPA: O-antigen ligase family protein, partial [Alphaproteobacteria bacterium]|nr:O-antigen ligase family protein [Alphaproteobacteria bacterium]
IFIFKQIEVLYGLLYLVRLVNYFYFFVLVWNFAKQKTNQTLLTNSLLSLSLISALFGWIQYFTFPDLKPFFTFGWDEHLFRLAGTFLDPTFLGLLTVFGILISIFKKKWLFAVFLIISLAFTYSRASYLALFGGLFAIGFSQKKLKYVLLLVLSFGVLLTFLPLRGNVVLNISRSFSAIARVENYQETLKIFQTSPLFGIGFNNMCLARQKFIGPSSFLSHSCSGSDSSLLLILATTGIVGLISFLYLSIKVWKSSDNLFKVLAVSLTIHSIFSNSLFYSWIMSYVLIIFAVSLRGKVNN